MTKSDLKTGMVIATTDGTIALVMKGTQNGDVLVSDGRDIGKTTWGPLDYYNEDLTFVVEYHKGIPVSQETKDRLRIDAVYSFNTNATSAQVSIRNRSILWIRPHSM